MKADLSVVEEEQASMHSPFNADKYQGKEDGQNLLQFRQSRNIAGVAGSNSGSIQSKSHKSLRIQVFNENHVTQSDSHSDIANFPGSINSHK